MRPGFLRPAAPAGDSVGVCECHGPPAQACEEHIPRKRPGLLCPQKRPPVARRAQCHSHVS